MVSVNDEMVVIPVIELSNNSAQIGDLLVDAVSKWGFVYVRSFGSGFPPEIIDRTFEVVRLGVYSWSRFPQPFGSSNGACSLVVSFERPTKRK